LRTLSRFAAVEHGQRGLAKAVVRTGVGRRWRRRRWNTRRTPRPLGRAGITDFEVPTGGVHRAWNPTCGPSNSGCHSQRPTSGIPGTKNNGPGRARAGKFGHGGTPQQDRLGLSPAPMTSWGTTEPRSTTKTSEPPGGSKRLLLVREGVYFVTWGKEGSRTCRCVLGPAGSGTASGEVVPDRCRPGRVRTDQRVGTGLPCGEWSGKHWGGATPPGMLSIQLDLVPPDRFGAGAADFEALTGDVHRASCLAGCGVNSVVSGTRIRPNNWHKEQRPRERLHRQLQPRRDAAAGSLGSPPLADMVGHALVGVNQKSEPPGGLRAALAVREGVYCVTWWKEGSRMRRCRGIYPSGGTANPASFQTTAGVNAPAAISASETAFLATHDQPSARAAQHRPWCQAPS
jgi:hypothetical protein